MNEDWEAPSIYGKIDIDVKFDDGYDFKMSLDKLRKLSIFCGQNGVGKSMVLRWKWYISFLMQMYKVTLMTHPGNIDAEFKQMVDRLLPLTFSGVDNFEGFVSIQDEDEDIYRMDLGFKEGKLNYFHLDMKDADTFKMSNVSAVMYNSKEARLFDSYERYLKMLKMMDIKMPYTLTHFETLGEFYKVYDVLWFERIRTFSMKWMEEGFPKRLQTLLSYLREGGCAGIPEDGELCFVDGVIAIQSGDKVPRTLSSFSDGEQALMMMYMFAGAA